MALARNSRKADMPVAKAHGFTPSARPAASTAGRVKREDAAGTVPPATAVPVTGMEADGLAGSSHRTRTALETGPGGCGRSETVSVAEPPGGIERADSSAPMPQHPFTPAMRRGGARVAQLRRARHRFARRELA